MDIFIYLLFFYLFMGYMIYRNGHSIPKELIIHLLKNLGCLNIVNNDYNIKKGRGKIIRGKLPDFICDYKGKLTPIEIGTIQGYKFEDDRIDQLLKKFDRVIYIFADSKYLLLNCVVYTTKDKNILKKQEIEYKKYNKIMRELEHQIETIQKNIHNFKKKVKNLFKLKDENSEDKEA